MYTLPVSFYEHVWSWGKYSKGQMQYLVSCTAITVEDYERITKSSYPPKEEELSDNIFTTR